MGRLTEPTKRKRKKGKKSFHILSNQIKERRMVCTDSSKTKRKKRLFHIPSIQLNRRHRKKEKVYDKDDPKLSVLSRKKRGVKNH